MNVEPVRDRTGLAYAAAILGCFLIVGALVWAMRHYAEPAPLGTERGTARARALLELRAGESEAVDAALRAAHQRLSFRIEPEFPLLTGPQIRYNQAHG